MLRVIVESASNIPKTKFGKPDPIVSVIFKDEKKKTRKIDSELNPFWNEILEFDLKGIALDNSSSLTIIVKDFETIGQNKLIGSASVALKDLVGNQSRSFPFKLVPLLNEKGQETGATIDLVVGYEPPAGPANPNDPGGTNTQEDGEDDGGYEDGVDGPLGGVTPTVPSGTKEAQLAKRITKGKTTRRILSNKPQDFQIRVRVIEGRQLPGNNIKPVVKVHVCGQTHRTRIKRGNNPYFDEIFFYNVHMTPLELLDETISIRVYDSHSLRADCLMGEFKIDIGYVYDEPGHAVMRKWLLLSDPEDTNSGARGYMKVSMFVLGTGDEPPVEKRERDNEGDDVESNLLLPAGIALRWVTFLLKIYRAEDIPQMDDAFAQTVKEIFGGEADKKNLVDPFVEVSFAGKKVCTNIIEKNANPEWNQIICLQIKFPSMCEKIKLAVVDWDRLTKNDVVGTTYLSLSKIASSGGEVEANSGETEVGFLPTFGPCYLNFYGSPREYTGFPDPYDELNFGKGEGVAYRGRILVELSTILESKPVNKKLEMIPNDDLLVVEYPQDKTKDVKMPVELRINIWLGLSAVEKKFNSFAEGTFSVFAEMVSPSLLSYFELGYENQALLFGKWGTSGLVGRHKFSDVTGKIKLKREYFLPPKGWEWEGEWMVDPERSLLTEADAGHTEFTDEVYENESRYPGGEWKAAEEGYTDVNGEKAPPPREFTCPLGWMWEDDAWKSDLNRAVDEHGWEYGITIPPDTKPKSWVAAEKMYHTHRRRRLVRKRKRDLAQAGAAGRAMSSYEDQEGWEYASLIGWKFHWKQRSSDTFRRRRWRRKMAPSETHDPYAHVSFLHQSKTTEIIHSTLNPTWDQTLIFNEIDIYGDPQTVAQNPPNVVIELFDSDQVGKDEFLGRSVCSPMVKLVPEEDITPKLLWYPVINNSKAAGDILFAAELILRDKGGTNLPILPSQRAPKLYMVPQGIRPVVQLTAVEVQFALKLRERTYSPLSL
ncbi:myoferlin isoform x2 [Limosa lapponica baueri]|uniref:Myoferlin isoform x2 n=1 Tax=Limosa lapponica baueri TaxID=1758121 RepID=A0A2I0TVB7_LIMLA|nr:myoferlin isoform x2 [Limosa lapponica baueri]